MHSEAVLALNLRVAALGLLSKQYCDFLETCQNCNFGAPVAEQRFWPENRLKSRSGLTIRPWLDLDARIKQTMSDMPGSGQKASTNQVLGSIVGR